jgi:hypothetical protein
VCVRERVCVNDYGSSGYGSVCVDKHEKMYLNSIHTQSHTHSHTHTWLMVWRREVFIRGGLLPLRDAREVRELCGVYVCVYVCTH